MLFSPRQALDALPPFRAKSINSHCSEKWAKWNGAEGPSIMIPARYLRGDEEPARIHWGPGVAFHLRKLTSRNPIKASCVFQPRSQWQAAVSLLNARPARLLIPGRSHSVLEKTTLLDVALLLMGALWLHSCQ